MKTRVLILVSCCFVLGAFSSVVAAQAPPKPGPEHDMLKKFEGEWDATANFGGNESKGNASYKIGLGGLWLLMDHKAELAGGKLEGRRATRYDPAQQQSVA